MIAVVYKDYQIRSLTLGYSERIKDYHSHFWQMKKVATLKRNIASKKIASKSHYNWNWIFYFELPNIITFYCFEKTTHKYIYTYICSTWQYDGSILLYTENGIISCNKIEKEICKLIQL